jgi:hypothetical protein
MAVLLCEKGEYAWTTCNEHVVQCIGDAARHSPDKEAVSAYDHHWRQALEKVLGEKDIRAEEQLHARANEFATGQRHHIGSRDTHHGVFAHPSKKVYTKGRRLSQVVDTSRPPGHPPPLYR